MTRLRAMLSEVSVSRRPVRFVIVGTLGFGLQVAMLEMLTAFAHWTWLPATIVAVELAVVHNFLWHERWTWRETSPATRRSSVIVFAGFEPHVMRFVRFNIVNGFASIAGNVALMALYTGVLHFPAIAGNVLAVTMMSVMNFVVADRWVFQYAHVDRTSRIGRNRQPGERVRSLAASRSALVVFMLAAAAPAWAAPRSETVAAWNRYVAETEARLAQERVSLAASNVRGAVRSRASSRETGREARPVPSTTSPASIACEGESINVLAGTISRWRGSMFLPGVALDQMLRKLQDPGTPPPQEDVAASRVLSRTPDSLRVYIRLVRTAIVTVTYDTEHEMQFERWDPAFASARSVAVRIEEVGGEDHGFLWRLNSYWRYRQMNGGILVELESLTLSRSVPMVVRPIAAPLITRVSRESMLRTLEALRRYMLQA